MARSTTGLKRVSRNAAIGLFLSTAAILGFSCLTLESTVWQESRAPKPPEPFYSKLPGVDLSGVPPEKLGALLKKLNVERCPCDCNRTIASCRNNHRSCPMSIAAARAEVAAVVAAARKR
jgi:hypothetical protein